MSAGNGSDAVLITQYSIVSGRLILENTSYYQSYNCYAAKPPCRSHTCGETGNNQKDRADNVKNNG